MKAPVCPRIPTANPAAENLGLRAGVGPAERAFLSPALSSVRGLGSRPPAGTRAVTRLCMVLSRFRSAPPPSRAPLTTSPAPRVWATPFSIPPLPPGWPPPPHCAGPHQPSPGPQVTLTCPQACVSAPALALPVQPHDLLLVLHPLFPVLWALGHFSLQAPSPSSEGLPWPRWPAASQHLSPSHLPSRPVPAARGVLSAWLPLHSAEFQKAKPELVFASLDLHTPGLSLNP